MTNENSTQKIFMGKFADRASFASYLHTGLSNPNIIKSDRDWDEEGRILLLGKYESVINEDGEILVYQCPGVI